MQVCNSGPHFAPDGHVCLQLLAHRQHGFEVLHIEGCSRCGGTGVLVLNKHAACIDLHCCVHRGAWSCAGQQEGYELMFTEKWVRSTVKGRSSWGDHWLMPDGGDADDPVGS